MSSKGTQKYFKNLKNKIMIWGIHYFITKQKRKLMSSKGAALIFKKLYETQMI